MNLPDGYHAALTTEPVEIQTMMCQDISNAVAYAIYASTQATTPPPKGDNGRVDRGGLGGNSNYVAVPVNCNCCGKEGPYVWDCSKRNTYWDPPPAGTVDAATKVHCKKGDKSDVTMSYLSVCKRWDYHNAPCQNTWQAIQGGASGTDVHDASTVDDVGDM